MATFSRFFGRAASEAAGFAAGVAVGPVLAPVVEEVRLEAWDTHPVKRIDAETAAAIVAEDVERRDWGAHEASGHGFDAGRFDALLGEALNAPGIPQLFEAWRRDLIDDAAFEHGLRKAKLEPRWDEPLKGLKQRLLSLDELANARQQGFVTADRQHSEAALQGQDAERADIAFELSGLPLGVETMQFAANRGLVDRATFDQAIREGHTKTKYTDLAWQLRQPVLSAGTYRTLHLKGWISEAEMNAGGALHGYTPEQMNLLYLEAGRPAAPGQMATAAARGIDGPEGRPMDEAQFLKGIKESDIRPEWGPMLWDARYLYPPLFQISRLVQAGAIDAETAAKWARYDRYPPEVVDALHAYWTQGTASGPSAQVKSEQGRLRTAAHKSYVAHESDDVAATTALQAAGVPAADVAAILTVWQAERELIRAQLAPGDIRKAFQQADVNAATGVPWTHDDALAALVARGWSMTDAESYLAIPYKG